MRGYFFFAPAFAALAGAFIPDAVPFAGIRLWGARFPPAGLLARSTRSELGRFDIGPRRVVGRSIDRCGETTRRGSKVAGGRDVGHAGQLDREDTTYSGDVTDAQLATIKLYRFLGDRETEAQA